MADTERIKRNVQKMIDQGAPDSEIDAYLGDEGVTHEQLQSPGLFEKGGLSNYIPGLQYLDDLTSASAQGVTHGWGDELYAKTKSALTGSDYHTDLARQQVMNEAARQRAPIGSAIAEGASEMAASPTYSQGGLFARGLIGAGEGAGYGALDAGGRGTDVKTGATIGALSGLVAPWLTGVTKTTAPLAGRVGGMAYGGVQGGPIGAYGGYKLGGKIGDTAAEVANTISKSDAARNALAKLTTLPGMAYSMLTGR